jgi:hypothetical protein
MLADDFQRGRDVLCVPRKITDGQPCQVDVDRETRQIVLEEIDGRAPFNAKRFSFASVGRISTRSFTRSA